ncbi:MAG: CheR family methyltransferase [Leptolyngbyaceae cyanobacterium]
MPSAESLNPELVQAFVQLVVERTGLKIRENDRKAFEQNIIERTQATELNSPKQYYRILVGKTYQSHQEWEKLTTEITNNESFFFRDKGQFKLLKTYIFPELIKRNSDHKTIFICSAGCSTGEEPYSMAMLLVDLIPNIEEWNIKILGIDISSVAVESAKQGIYRPWSFRGMEHDIRSRFFKEIDECYHISDDIKKMVSFQTGNLLESSLLQPFSSIRGMDLILCRNVFIYFSHSAIETVLDRFYNALSPLGYLLAGHAELYGQTSNKFWIKAFEDSFAYQRPESAASATKTRLSSPARVSPSQPVTENVFRNLDDSMTEIDIKMQKAALNLLRQLPADTKIARLGNLTASELILQFEQAQKKID